MRRILIVLAALALVISVGAGASARTTRPASATARAASPAQEERRLLCTEGDPLCAETAEAIGPGVWNRNASENRRLECVCSEMSFAIFSSCACLAE